MLAAATGATLSAADRASAAESCAVSGQPCVIVHVKVGDVETQTLQFTRDQIYGARDFTGDFWVRGNPNTVPSNSFFTFNAAYTLNNFITDSLHRDVASVTSIVVDGFIAAQTNQPHSVTLTPDDLASTPANTYEHSPSAFALMNGPSESSISIYRPPAADPADSNLQDVETGSLDNGPLEVTVNAVAPVVTLELSASTTKPKPNASVTFTAKTTPVTTGTFTWDFGDQSTRTGSSVTHAFTTAGKSYTVRLAFKGSDGSVGATSKVIVVGKTAPPANGNRPGTGSNTNPNAPATGPTAGNGTRVGARDSTTRGTGNSLTNGTKTTGGSAAPTTTTGGTEDLSLPLITGQLIGSTQPLSAAAFVQQELDSATAPGAHTPPAKGPTIPAWVGVAAGFLALFAFGILSEVRPTLRRRKR